MALNKGLTKEIDGRVRKCSETRKRLFKEGKIKLGYGCFKKGDKSWDNLNSKRTQFKKGDISWSKGLTKETDERVNSISLSLRGKFKGEHRSIETEFKKGHNKGLTFQEIHGTNSEKIRKQINKTRREGGWFKDVEKTKEIMSESFKKGYKDGTRKLNSNHFKKGQIPWNEGNLKKNKYCCDCKKEIQRYGRSIRCNYCKAIGKNNPMYGVTGINHHNFGTNASFETLRKKSAAHQGIPIEEWEKFISREPYGKNWTDKFKRAIRKRDNQVCMMCGIHKEKYGKTFNIHHINYDKKLTILQNCISLCNSCHAKTNFDRNIWTKHFQDLLSNKYNYLYSENGEIKIKL